MLPCLILLLACAPSGDLSDAGGSSSGGGGAGGGGVDTVPAPLTLTLDATAIDPHHRGVSAFVTGPPGDPITLTVTTANAQLFTQETALDDKGAATLVWDAVGAPTGAATVTVTSDDDEASAPLALVHAGFTAVYAEDDAGVTATAIPMYWGADGVLQDLGQPISALPALDDGDGHQASFPPATERLAMASTVDGGWPVAWSAGSQPMVTLTLDAAPGGLDAAEVHVSAEGWIMLAGDPLVAGQPVTLQREAPLDDTIGVTDETLTVALTVDGAELSHQDLPLRAYRLLGPPTFGRNGDRYAPWAWPVDDIVRELEGTPATHDAVADAVVRWVFNDLGLRYDTVAGASAYSNYGGVMGDQWDDVDFLFTQFLMRSFGDVINCTDAGNIVTTYSNMLGAELHHIVILRNFDLDYIRAIGTQDFTHCPFGPGSCGFSYHAVTTSDGGATIWDATLVLDGDPDPGRPPFTDLPVQHIPGAEYLDRLVRSGRARFNYESQGTIQ